MELQEFTQKLKEQFIDCDTIELTPDTAFRSIKSFDSLTGMAAMMMIEENFGTIITEDTFRLAQTPRELYNAIHKQ